MRAQLISAKLYTSSMFNPFALRTAKKNSIEFCPFLIYVFSRIMKSKNVWVDVPFVSMYSRPSMARTLSLASMKICSRPGSTS